MTIDPQETPADIISRHPETLNLFLEWGMDFWSEEKQSLEDQCQTLGLDLQDTLEQLSRNAPSEEETIHWNQAPLDDLLAHLFQKHHTPFRRQIDDILVLCERANCERSHKAFTSFNFKTFLREFCDEMVEHMNHEEQVVFPAILKGTVQRARPQDAIELMKSEHLKHAGSLGLVLEFCESIKPMENGCKDCDALHESLMDLAQHVMVHMYLENHIVLPRALAGEGAIA